MSHRADAGHYNPAVTEAASSLFSWRRARRHGAVVLAIALLVVILRLIWGQLAERRLDAALAEVSRTGAPVTMTALHPELDPDPANNAVADLLAALNAIDGTIDSPSQSNLTYNDYPPYPPAWHTAADGAIANNARSLQLTRQARGKGKFFWPPNALGFASNPALNQARNLANLLGDAALHAQIHRNDLEAIERVRDVFHLADAVDHQSTFVAHLVAIGIRALGTARLQLIAPQLKLPANDGRDPLRQRLRILISQLLDDAAGQENLRRGMLGERIMQIDQLRTFADGDRVLAPMYKLDLINFLKIDEALIASAAQPNWPAVKAQLASVYPNRWGTGVSPLTKSPRPAPRLSRPFSGNTYLARYVETDLRGRMCWHMTAVSLAAQLYRADHNGRWPATIDALVPAYLPAVPIDPLGPTGQKMRLHIVKNALPNGADRVLVYAIGTDGRDDSAKPGAIPATPTFEWISRRGAIDDQCLDIEMWSLMATTAPATAPAAN